MSKRYKAKRRERCYRRTIDLINPPCWCGVRNPYFAPVRGGCGGLGYVQCFCGGDICVCHNHGEVECPGCDECEAGLDDDFDWDEQDD